MGRRGGGCRRARPRGGASRCVVMPRSLPTRANARVPARPTTTGSASRNASTSAAVDDQPTLTRSERSASTPIAASTGDGSSDSLEHDEPECTATPCWSSASRIGSASTPLDAEAHEVGEARDRVAVALDARRRAARVPAASRSVSAALARPRLRLEHRRLAVHAAPKPTIAGTFSMPPRRARSCAPPTTNGGNRSPRRTSSAAAPFGPPSLWAVTEQRSAPSAAKSTATWPAAAHASTCTSAPRVACTRATTTARRVAACRPRGWRAAPTRARCRARTAASTSSASKRPERSTPITVIVGAHARSRRARTSAPPRW